MKELSIEEKARAYDKALARAKEQLNGAKVFDYDNEQVAHDIRTTAYNIFPELKELTDEGIKESIAGFLKTISSLKDGQTLCNEDFDTKVILEWVAWLKKQGKQSPAEWHIEDEQNLNACLGYIPDEFLKRWLKDIIHIKYDKPIDKVEPKFHVGDFIKHNVCNIICKVITVNSESYYVESIKTGCRIECFSAEQNFHLWTIEDAKDGDVLAVDWYQDDDSWEKIIIFKKYHNKGVEGLIHTPCVEGYGNTFKNGKMVFDEEVPYYSKTWTANLHPATKEQREFLFQEMKDAGYEWDVKKKELKKIEDVPENYKRQVMSEMTNLVKDYIQQKPTWSEDDEKMFQTIIADLKGFKHDNTSCLAPHFDNCIAWLNSLKDRYTWKPSDEQMDALNLAIGEANAVDTAAGDEAAEILTSLYEQLKKIMEK